MKWEGLKKEAPEETPLASPGSPPAWTSLGESVVLPPLYLEVQDAFMRLLKHVQRRTVALAAAAHELKTPLTIITGYTEFLLSEKVTEQLSGIESFHDFTPIIGIGNFTNLT